jgi:acetylornithine deacetylase/succinyl-diaminopimelate desuccinylase-like protein
MVMGALLQLMFPASATAALATPPAIEFATDEAYDAASVARYTGSHDAIYAHIDANVDAHLAELQRWVRQPSVSAQSRGIGEMADLLARDLEALGFGEVARVPTAGHPGVFAFHDAGAPRTLLVYFMYDVQPEETGWQVGAFDGALVDTDLGKVLMARGATNQKGPERAFLNALASIRAVDGKLPVNVMVLAEGEEELGSPHMPDLVAAYEARLRAADAVLFSMNSQGPDGAVTLNLGVKGNVVFELEARGSARGGPTQAEIHSSLKAVVDAPAWRLVQALATLVSADGNTILVPGYYDAIRAPDLDEQRLVNALAKTAAAREAAMKRTLGVERFIDGLAGRDLIARQLFATTLNINGLWSGYTGAGMKTILPHVATVRVDSRFVPNQEPDEQLALIRKHLDASGFTDVTLRKLAGYPAAQTRVGEPFVQSAIGVLNKWDRTPAIAPRLAGSAPYYLFTERLGLPLLAVGLGHGSGAHAPNEYMVVAPKPDSRIAGLAEIEKFYVDLVFSFAEHAGT